MSEKLQHENAEIDYINAILCSEESAVPLTEVANNLIDKFEMDDAETTKKEAVESEIKQDKISKSIIKNDVDNKNNYQLFFVSGFKVAVLQSTIHEFVDVSEVEINGNVLLYQSKDFNIININHLMGLPALSNKQSKYVLLTGENLALNCEKILNVEKIEDDAVCWRDENSKRYWLAGTVKKRNMILLDTMALHNKNGNNLLNRRIS